MNKTFKACQHCKIHKSCQLFSHLKLIEATHPAELVDIGNDLDHICADLCRDNMTADEAIRLVNKYAAVDGQCRKCEGPSFLHNKTRYYPTGI